MEDFDLFNFGDLPLKLYSYNFLSTRNPTSDAIK